MMVGSDFSLTGHDTDLEMDYYDYNVHNTSAVPGSYLGMDPAYCVWIPPFAPGQWVDNGSEEEDSSSTNEIEMRMLDSKRSDSRSETPKSEKFQRECVGRRKEKFKRYSSISTASSSNKTIVPEELASEDDLTIQEALSPDSPVKVQKAFVVKEANQSMKISTLLESSDDLKFADDDDDEDSDTAYNSEENIDGMKQKLTGRKNVEEIARMNEKC